VEYIQMGPIERANLSLRELHAPDISAGLNWDRTWARTYEICGGQSGIGTGFLRVLEFPLPSIPPTVPHSSSSITIEGWYNRPVVTSVIAYSVPLHPRKEKETA
jgi:hypothetical protein